MDTTLKVRFLDDGYTELLEGKNEGAHCCTAIVWDESVEVFGA